MNPIRSIEDAILERIKRAIPNLRSYGYAPADWSEEIAKQFLNHAPSVLVAFVRYKKRAGYFDGPKLGQFALFCLTADGTEESRRRGDSRALGAYDIATLADASLDGFLLHNPLDQAPLGTVAVEGCDNLFTTQLWDMGGTCYALQLEIPFTIEHPAIDEQGVNTLDTVHVDWDVRTFASAADHERWVNDDRSEPSPDAQDVIGLN